MLIGMKQRKNEYLWEFITRFNTDTLEVIDLDQMVAMSAMKGALKPSRFFFSLEKKFSTSFLEMLSRAEKYPNVEEAFMVRKTSVPSASDKEKEKKREKDKRKRKEPPNNGSSAQVRGSPKSSALRFHNYTSLNGPRSEILMEIQDQLPPARWMYTPPARRNHNRHYRYYRDHGHNTDEFLQLKHEIERLIHRGCLAWFDVEPQPQPRSAVAEPTAQKNADNRPTTGTIHTIGGGIPSTNTLDDQLK